MRACMELIDNKTGEEKMTNAVTIHTGIPGAGKTKGIDDLLRNNPNKRKIYLILSHKQLRERSDFLPEDLLKNDINQVANDPNLTKRFMNYHSKQVKRDEAIKKVIFLTALSAYTRNPINLFIRGDSSLGKTYNTVETLRYIHVKDVLMLGGLSLTALVHQEGELVSLTCRKRKVNLEVRTFGIKICSNHLDGTKNTH